MDTPTREEILIMPSIGLAYFDMLRRALQTRGHKVIFSNRLPRKGLFFSKKFTAIHVHMVDFAFATDNIGVFLWRLFVWAFAVIPVCKLRGIRIVWTCHEWTPHEGYGATRASLASHILVRVADHVIVHSNEVLDTILKKHPGRPLCSVSLLPHGDLRDAYQPFADMETTNGTKPVEPLCFSSIGFMRRNKGTDLVIQAFRLIDRADTRLVLAGACLDPTYHEALIALAGDDERITFVFGNVDDELLVRMHRSSAAIVFGFRDCPTSGSVVTAMSLGATIIAPRVGHVKDLINDENGWSVDPSDIVGGLRDAMLAVIANPTEASRRRVNARIAASRQDWNMIVRELETIYRGDRQ